MPQEHSKKVWLGMRIVARFFQESVHYRRVGDLMSQDSRTTQMTSGIFHVSIYHTSG